MATIRKRDLLLLLIGIDTQGYPRGGLSGVTRLQKFLFLLEREAGFRPSGEGFEFEPYKAGPYSPKLYDELELLENLGLLTGRGTVESTMIEHADIDKLTFEDLIGGPDEVESSSRTPDAFEERQYSLTELGREKIEALIRDDDQRSLVDAIRKLKTKYGNYSLTDLLRYVYRKYPEMTTRSEILDKVMGRPDRK